MNTFLEQTKDKLIVSCQALPDEPLHSPFIMSKMALAAKMAGAAAIRANSVVDIKAIQAEVSLPVIGLSKVDYPDSDVYITPTLKEMIEIAKTGVFVVACDATIRKRPNDEDLAQSVKAFRTAYPNTLLMADTATLEDVLYANKLGFDLVGTTLHGYTKDTEGKDIAENDFKYLKEVLKVAQMPVIAEGKVDTPKKAKRCLELGCHAVVVGGAITRPLEIASRFVKALEK